MSTLHIYVTWTIFNNYPCGYWKHFCMVSCGQRCVTPPADVDDFTCTSYVTWVLCFSGALVWCGVVNSRGTTGLTIIYPRLPRTSNKLVYHIWTIYSIRSSRIIWTFCFVSNFQWPSFKFNLLLLLLIVCVVLCHYVYHICALYLCVFAWNVCVYLYNDDMCSSMNSR